MKVSVRFAPSPTGFIHVGNARKAIINNLFSIKNKGRYLLRLDDTDTKRCKNHYIHALKQDLEWLGLKFNTTKYQSNRIKNYKNAIKILKDSGRIYPCYETIEELQKNRTQQIKQKISPIYNRNSLKLNKKKTICLENTGKKPHWRFKLKETKIEWVDEIQGKIIFNPGHLSDPIILRENGMPIYTLTSIIDDIELGITHIIRGADHISNTAVQLQICDALKIKKNFFSFAHFPLLTDSEGNKLSKRLKNLSLKELREKEIDPEALSIFLMALGTKHAPKINADIKSVANNLKLNFYGKASTKFCEKKLYIFNKKWIRNLDYESIKKSIVRYNKLPNPFTIDFWNLIAPCVNKLSDINIWYEIFYEKYNPKKELLIEDKKILKIAYNINISQKWSSTTWDLFVLNLKNNTHKKGNELFQPLRIALTNLEHGPELKKIFYFLGKQEVLKRLRIAYY